MIKIRKKINLIALIIFAFLIKPVFSQENYSIENLRMYINVDAKGDAHIIENITYKFHSQSEGVTRSLYLGDDTKLDNLRAYELYPNKKQLQLDLFNNNYNLDFRVYNKSNVETKIYKIEYDLEDFIIRHNGGDELKFKIFDIDNSSPVEKLTISIYFADSKRYKNIKAFQHGYLYKNIHIERNKVSYNIENFPQNMKLELAIFLEQDIPVYTIEENNEYLLYEKLVNEQLNIEKIYKNTISRIDKINILSISILIIEFFYVIVLFFDRLLFQKGKLPRNYNLKLPEDCTPAIMISIMKYKKITSRDFLITILDLIRKGYISEMNDEINKKYKLLLTNKSDENLKIHEKYLLNWLFCFSENDKIVCLDDIKKYNQDEKKFLEFKRFYNTWKRKVYEECKNYGYLKKNKVIKLLLYLYSYFKILLGVFFIFEYSPYLHILSITLIISGLINNIYIIKSKLTRLGYKERKKWISFKKFIINFKNTKALNSDNAKIWESYIIYSISLSVQKELLYKLRNNKEIINLIYLNKSNDKNFIQLINRAFRTNELDYIFIFKKSNK
ncbi:DUF2207 domain-containing protein [Tepidibacter mesophilus]|uniref:DUF2207 domain-containing protein n=1 Tax=Tepidibacter mesophilus TaxID=655607 RepID=UPI000C088CAB|nr:DUF2207 domain-containing protein [Tepidibacter mesophilus]